MKIFSDQVSHKSMTNQTCMFSFLQGALVESGGDLLERWKNLVVFVFMTVLNLMKQVPRVCCDLVEEADRFFTWLGRSGQNIGTRIVENWPMLKESLADQLTLVMDLLAVLMEKGYMKAVHLVEKGMETYHEMELEDEWVEVVVEVLTVLMVFLLAGMVIVFLTWREDKKRKRV